MIKLNIFILLFSTACAKENPNLWGHESLNHVVEYKNKTIETAQWNSLMTDKMQTLIKDNEDNPEYIDKLLDIARKNHDCLVQANLPPSFYAERNNRHGFAGWTIDGKTESFPKDNTKIKSSKYYIEKQTEHREQQIKCFKEFDSALSKFLLESPPGPNAGNMATALFPRGYILAFHQSL